MSPIALCTCGETKPHVVARRPTADGKHVLLWDDGSLTWALGYHIRGGAHPRTLAQIEAARKAGWLVVGEVCLYTAAEVPDLVKAARWVAARSGLPGDVRKRYVEITTPKGPRPNWIVLRTDRDGRPTVRVWRLPRLLYPGLIVWHERGRYEVLRELHRDAGAYEATGFRATTLREILTMLPKLKAV